MKAQLETYDTGITTSNILINVAANDDNNPPPIPPANIASAFIEQYENNVLNPLAEINSGIEEGTCTPNDLISLTKPEFPRLRAIYQLVLNNQEVGLTDIDKNKLLRCLGMTASSLERHLQTAGNKPGAAFHHLPVDTDKVMLVLAKDLRGNARDDHYAYWELADFIPYTNHPGELMFAHTVRLSNKVLNQSADNLRAVTQKELSLDTPEATVILNQMTNDLASLRNDFKELGFKLGNNGFFATSMRQYLLPYAIGGTMFHGPNAKYFPCFARMDLAFGIKNEHYLAELTARLPFMTSEDKAVFEKELNVDTAPSLTELLVETIQPLADLNDPIAVALEFSKLPRTFRQNLLTLSKIAKLWVEISGIHLALIQKQLVSFKPTSEQVNLPVPLSQGVSGSSLQQVFDLHRLLRQNAWATTTLVKAARLLAE